MKILRSRESRGFSVGSAGWIVSDKNRPIARAKIPGIGSGMRGQQTATQRYYLR
jgi:hypothetical protein